MEKERKTFSKTEVVRQSSENTSEATHQQHPPERMAESYFRAVLQEKILCCILMRGQKIKHLQTSQPLVFFFDRERRRRDGGREANGPGRKVHNRDELRDGGTALRGKETVS